MTLPASRNTTYSAGSSILSNDLNAVQDCIIGRKHGPITITIHGSRFSASASSVVVTKSQAGVSQAGGSAPSFIYGLDLPIGSRILSARAYLRDNAAGPTAMYIALKKYIALTSTFAGIGLTPASLGSGAYQALSVGAVAETVVAGTNYSLELIQSGGGTSLCQLHYAEIDIDAP